MQGFSVNHQEEELISEKAIRHRVGQCFPQVEKGSFFPGDAYAVYSESFAFRLTSGNRYDSTVTRSQKTNFTWAPC